MICPGVADCACCAPAAAFWPAVWIAVPAVVNCGPADDAIVPAIWTFVPAIVEAVARF